MNYADALMVMQISGSIDKKKLKQQYKALSRKFHPDSPGGSEDLFTSLQLAYKLLTDAIENNIEISEKSSIIIPYANYMQLLADGFTITPDGVGITKEYISDCKVNIKFNWKVQCGKDRYSFESVIERKAYGDYNLSCRVLVDGLKDEPVVTIEMDGYTSDTQLKYDASSVRVKSNVVITVTKQLIRSVEQ